MKRIFSLILSLMVVLIASAQTVQLSVPQDLSYGPGKTLQIPVNLDNAVDVTAVQFDVSVPLTISAHQLLPNRCGDHEYIIQNKSNYSRVMIYSSQNTSITGSSGTIMTLSVDIPENAENGKTYEVKISNVIIGNRAGQNVATGSQNGLITVQVQPRPDLKPSNISVNQTICQPGGTLDFTWEVQNVGDLATGAGWTEKFYLEDEDGYKVYMGTTAYEGTLDAGANVSRSHTLKLSDYPGVSGNLRPVVEVIPSANCGELSVDKANNTASAADYNLYVKKYLYLFAYERLIPENSTGSFACEVRRTGSLKETQTFEVTQIDAKGNQGRLNFRNGNKVTFSKGSNRAYFYVSPVDNQDVNVNQEVFLTLNANENNGYNTVVDTVRIEDNEKIAMTLTTDKVEYQEGESIRLTVNADRHYPGDMIVYFNIEKPGRFKLPTRLVMKEDVTEASIDIPIIQDKDPANDVDIKITATAEYYDKAETIFVLKDDDVPAISMRLTPTDVNETAGPSAMYGTIVRSGVTNNKITIKLSDDGNDDLYYSVKSITLPAGTTTANFPLGVKDNAEKDGDRVVNLKAAVYISDCNCDATGDKQTSVVVPITITDDDGPMLSLKTNKSTILEGDAVGCKLTVSRNTQPDSPLTVNLSSRSEDLTFPETVVIPAGEKSVTVTLAAKSNDVEEGDRTVSVYASSDGFSMGTCWVLISDRTLPDVAIESSALNKTSCAAGESLQLNLNVKNVGAAPLPVGTPIIVRANGATLAQYTTQEVIGKDEVKALSVPLVASAIPGEYQITAEINPEKTVSELLYLNNTTETHQLTVTSLFTFAIQSEKDVYNVGEVVKFDGRLSAVDGANVSGVRVQPYILYSGNRIVLDATTDAEGAFAVEYTIPEGYRGKFLYGACNVGEDKRDATQHFNVYGFSRTDNSYIKHEVYLNEPYVGVIALKNLSELPLTGLKVEVTGATDKYRLELDMPDGIAGNQESVGVNYTLTPLQESKGSNWETLNLHFTTNEVASLDVVFYNYTRVHHAKLVASTTSINTTATKGVARNYPIILTNTGLAATGKIKVSLPQGLSSFISLATPEDMPSMNTNDSTTIMLRFNPTDEFDVNVIQKGNIAINCENGNGLSVYFNVKVVSEEKGGLLVKVRDENTIYGNKDGEHPYVANATVELKDYNTGRLVAQMVTGEEGTALFENINEGYYQLYVTSPKHDSYRQNIVISPGETLEHLATISYQAVSVTWDVVETEVEDEYEIVSTLTYETHVPVPVVRMTMPKRLNLDELEYGRSTLFNIVLRNDGLITAQNVWVELFEVDGYTVTPLVQTSGITLGPECSTVIPVTVTRNQMSTDPVVQSSGSSACSGDVKGGYEWPCGSDSKFGWIGDVVNFFSENMSCSDAGDGGGGGSFTPSGGPGGPGAGGIDVSAGAGGAKVDAAGMKKLFCTLLECIPIDIPVPGEDCTRIAINLIRGHAPGAGGVIGCISYITKKVPGLGPVVSCLEALMKDYAPSQGGVVKSRSKQAVAGDLREWYDKAKIYLDYCETLNKAVSEKLGCTQLVEVNDEKVMEAIDLIDMELYDMYDRGVLFDVDLNTIPDDYSAYEKAIAEGTGGQWLPAQGKISAAHLTSLMPGGVANWYDFSLKRYVERMMNAYRQENKLEPIGDNKINYAVFEETSDSYDAIQKSIIDKKLVSIQEVVESANEDRLNYFEGQSSSTCATVKLEIEQKLVMTRQAFRGTLTVDNSMANELHDIDLNVIVTNMLGEQTTNHEMQINFESITGFEGELDGPWTLAPKSKGVATILFIPTKYAAPDTLTTYSFGGNLYFKDSADGVVQSRELYPVKLQVKPSPELDLTYFMQRDIYGDNPLTKDVVEPVVPAEFSVMLRNKGKGNATNIRMLTKQPKIVENEKGLLVDFAIVSSSLNGGEKAMALDSTIATQFGDIAPGASSYATWDMTSSLLGHFIDYDIRVNHVTSYGNPDLSLLDEVTIHELIHSVDITLGDSVHHAWLTNDETDGKDLPDHLYFLDGTVHEVFDASASTTIQSAGDSKYTLSIQAPMKGWYYAGIADPTQSMAKILSVNFGGQEINPNCIWQTQYTMPDNKDPLRDNRIHVVFYADSPKTLEYDIQFEPTPDVRLVVESIETLPREDQIAEQVIENLTVAFNKEIQPATFTREDITLRHEGQKLEKPIAISQLTEKTFSLDMSSFTENGFYTLQVHADDITDHEGFKGYEGLMVKWMLFKDGLIHYNIGAWPSNDVGNITTSRDENSGSAEYGDEMTIEAEPAYGYEFSYWGNPLKMDSPAGQKRYMLRSGANAVAESDIEKVSTENPIVVPLNKDIDLIAVFKPKKMKVNIICDEEAGTTSVGSGFYDYGTVMNIEAAAKDGYRIKGFVVHDSEYQEGDEVEVAVDRDVVNVEVLFESTTPQNVLMQDTEDYQPVDVPLANVKLYRSFRKGTWNTICLPCAVDNPTDVFGEGTRVARLSGLEDDVMQFATVNHMLPNIPYLIMVGSIENSSMENGTSKRTFYDITNTSVVEPEYTQPIDQHDGVAFIGSYETTTVPAGQGYYYISSGALWYIDSDAIVTSGRFRGYFHASNSSTQTMAFRIDDIVTGIPFVEVTATDDVFNLMGIKVCSKGDTLKHLSPGVYISKGKKFLIK